MIFFFLVRRAHSSFRLQPRHPGEKDAFALETTERRRLRSTQKIGSAGVFTSTRVPVMGPEMVSCFDSVLPDGPSVSR